MIDEVLFMQTRLFRMFVERSGLPPASAYDVFDAGGIWRFLEDCYDILHMSGDEAALDDVLLVLEAKGVTS